MRIFVKTLKMGVCALFALALGESTVPLAGKHANKVKVACAREMVGFVWESLNQAAAA
jgi:hypothetical protein